jgi:hypothetical protein
MFSSPLTNLIIGSGKDVYLNNKKITTFSFDGNISGTQYEGKYFFTDGNDIYVYGRFPSVESEFVHLIGTALTTNTWFAIVNPPSDYVPLDMKGEGDTATAYLQGRTVYDFNNKTLWYEPCKKELEDNYKGANVIPSDVKYILNHKGRLFISGSEGDDDNIFISDVQNPYYYPVGLPIQIPPDSDRVVGMIEFDDAAIIGRHNDIYAITGETNRLDVGYDLFTLRKLNTHTGFINNNCVNHVHNYLFFLGNDGVAYALSSISNNERILSTSVLSKQIDLFKKPISLNKVDLDGAVTCFYDDNWYVSIKDKVLVYSYEHRAWTVLDGMKARCFHIANRQLIWGNDNGQVATFSDGYLDFGSPFISYYETKDIDCDSPSLYKNFRDFYIVTKLEDGYETDIYTDVYIDNYKAIMYDIISYKPSKWGETLWGDELVNYDVIRSVSHRINKRGRNIRFRFTNGYKVTGTVDLPGELYSYPNKVDGTLIYVWLDESIYFFHHSQIDSSITGGTLDEQLKAMGWRKLTLNQLNQPMRIHQINFNYEEKGVYR